MRAPNATDESGFTLIEVLASVLVLVIGMLATFTLIDGANATISANTARSGATNLARELIEYSRGADYGRLTPTEVEGALRTRPKVAGSGDPWTLERRGVTYTIAATACTFDDPKDGLSSTPPDNPCPAAAAVSGAPANDINPDDFRRVTLTLTWKVRNTPGKATQSALIVNPAGGLGPRIPTFDPQPSQIYGTDTVRWGAPPLPQLISQNAAGVRWTVDDGRSQGDAVGGPTNWAFDWNLGVRNVDDFNASWVLDGTYTVFVQAKDSRGVPGEPKAQVVHVNRGVPGKPSGVAGGYNDRFKVVDMHWQSYPERDLRGYRVTRGSVDGQLICPSNGDYYTTATSCTDFAPRSQPDDRYYVRAVDCIDLSVSCVPRDGETFELVTSLVPGPRPAAPGAPTCAVVDGVPTLTWPAPGADILFHRIYRDTGTDIDDRYDETITATPRYEDPEPGTTGTPHQYWVTAVDASFNESDPSAPVTCTA